MARSNNRRPEPSGITEEVILLWVLLGLIVVGAGALSLAMHLGHALAGTGVNVPGNPAAIALGLADGELAWPGAAGWSVLIALAVLVIAIAVGAGLLVRRARRSRTRVDHLAASLGRGRDLEPISRTSVEATAKRLGVTGAAPSASGGAGNGKVPVVAPGVPIGVTVADRAPLYGSWEDLHVEIWGPRMGKTTSKAIPAILEAPGGVVVTSNKRDIVDATRGIRAAGDRPLYVFDLQDIAISPTGCDRTKNGQPPWWYDPLSYVTDEIRADKLADCFADAESGDHLKTDAHFDPLGKALLSAVLLAAALDSRPITAAYTWLTRIGDETPGEILRAGGYGMRAEQFFGIANTEKRERSSIYSTARRMAACLTYRHIIAWVTDDPATNPDGRPRPHFDPGEFVRSGGTLYSLSEEGKGNAGALTMALTTAVVEAAVEEAKASGGRLSTPLLVVLDEAANVCRWRELPSLYSHFGSRGIITMTILQSWSQGVGVWGQEGMKKLWSAANIKTYGGGVAEKEFLEMLSHLIGDHDRVVTSVSKGGGRGTQATVSRQLRRERILDVADLAALPKGRAIVLASGARPTLICTQPWLTGPRAEQVRASITLHDPAAQETIATMTAELAAANEHGSTATDYQVLATTAADR